MSTAEVSLSLLMSEDKDKASELVNIVDGYNRQRQKVEAKILQEAQELIEKEVNFKEHKIIVVAGQNWHEGVLGVVASKLADRFYRPTILISLSEDHCRGSGRSIESFHLFSALSECRELLETFGGHSHAAGLVITPDSIEDFRDKMNLIAKEKLRIEDLIPAIDIDMEIGLAQINDKLVTELSGLEPFGKSNPEPMFYTKNLTLKGQVDVMGKETIKFWATDGNTTCQVIGFGMLPSRESLLTASSFDLVYIPQIDDWQGRNAVILEAKDIFFK